jgi:hypothetical protein
VLSSRKETEMTNRIFLNMALCTAIALPAFAQQTSSSSTQQATTAQNSAQSSQNTTTSPKEAQRDSHTDFWEGDEPSAAALIFHGFASKGYVQRHTGAIRDRLNELEQLNASNGSMTKDVDSKLMIVEELNASNSRMPRTSTLVLSKGSNWRPTRRKTLTSMPPMPPTNHS